MKKIKIMILFIAIIFFFCVINKVYASEEKTKLLYQDITINKDGSITIKEAAWLDGEYNGWSRSIYFKNSYATTFTGIYSNFAGNTDIYNGTSIKDIKVYDVSQENFNSIEDIGKIDKTYKEGDSIFNSKYGIYELTQTSSGMDFKIYCPNDKNKVICLEYTITDAVVVHNDVAELYWNVLGEYYEENIQDFQVIIHLPEEDNDVRIWTHGPLTGENKILDYKTLYFMDKNVDNYTPETIRIMFNSSLVPLATKKSNVNGRNNILKYEAMMADTANRERESAKLQLENEASQAVLNLEENKDIFYYNKALKLVNKLDETNEQKQDFLARIEKTKESVNENWKEDLKHRLEFLTESNYKNLTTSGLDIFKEKIQEGFDEGQKVEFLNSYNNLEKILNEKQAELRNKFLFFVIFINLVIGIIAIYKFIIIIDEKYKFKARYYRDFPNEDNPNVLEFLMKRKSTTIGFSATILSLINKKVIFYERNLKDDDITLILNNAKYEGSNAEVITLDLLFKIVGKENKCNLKDLKNYGKNAFKAKNLIKKMDEFKNATEEEVKLKKYFKENKTVTIYMIIVIINYIISATLTIGIFYGLDISVLQILKYLLIISSCTIIYLVIASKDKKRTKNGKEIYSKWLAHKRFLEDFSNFDEKDLPEITLWEKYLVTATVLGCADKVEKNMKMFIKDTSQLDTNLLIYQNINLELIKEINNTLQTSVNTSNSNINSSSYSSEGGFGGGSSIGGGRRWPAVAVEVVSKRISPYNKNNYRDKI